MSHHPTDEKSTFNELEQFDYPIMKKRQSSHQENINFIINDFQISSKVYNFSFTKNREKKDCDKKTIRNINDLGSNQISLQIQTVPIAWSKKIQNTC